MSTIWWHLPGPSQYVERVVQDIRQGRNCVLCLPKVFPEGLRNALTSNLGDGALMQWNTIHIDTPSRRPLDLLFRMFGGETPARSLRNVATLITLPDFLGRLCWLELQDLPQWPNWKWFITEYSSACRELRLLDRSVFCIALSGEAALDPPPDDVCLAIHRWRGHCGPLDALLFASLLLRDKICGPFRYELYTRLLANVALWDVAVAEVFAMEPQTALFAPEEVLGKIAEDRGWEPIRTECDYSWSIGASECFGGRPMIHPAALPQSERRSHLKRALWSAQAAVLLPLVEERRLDLISRLSRFLKTPYTTRFGEVIQDVSDLEIGHIESQLLDRPNQVNARTLQQVRMLRQVRNHLAHFEPISFDMLRVVEQLGLT
jgi:hypothetical protein